MKPTLILLWLACVFSPPLLGQSSVVFDVGTILEVQTGADLSADVVTINGTFFGGGTINGKPLPITLLSFTAAASRVGRGVELTWVTATEIENYGFYVQRSPDTLKAFERLPNSFQPGHGTTIEEHRYSYTDSTVTPGLWAYRMEQLDLDGTEHFSDAIVLCVLTSAKPEWQLPTEFALNQNYPNPFNPSTTIPFALPHHSHVRLSVYNALGQQVAILTDTEMEAGYHEVQFNASDLASGVYYYRIQADGFVRSMRLVLIK